MNRRKIYTLKQKIVYKLFAGDFFLLRLSPTENSIPRHCIRIEMPCIIINNEKVDVSTLGDAREEKRRSS